MHVEVIMGIRKATREEIDERRALWHYIRLNYACCICGSQNTLEFHHIDPATKYQTSGKKVKRLGIGDMKTYRWVTQRQFIEEMKKCALVCGACHDVIEGDFEGEVDTNRIVAFNPEPAIRQLLQAGVLSSHPLWQSRPVQYRSRKR